MNNITQYTKLSEFPVRPITKQSKLVLAGSEDGLTTVSDVTDVIVADLGDEFVPITRTINGQPLSGDITIDVTSPEHTHDNATASSDGFMSKEDKLKLDTMVGDFSDIVRASDIEDKASKEDLELKADKSDLSNFASKSDIEGKADRSELDSFVGRSDLDLKADKSELLLKADKSDLINKANVEDVASKADKTELELKVDRDELERVTIKNKGYYISEAKLKSSITSPVSGDYAMVGSPFPGTIWEFEGEWKNTGNIPEQDSVSLNDYIKKDAVGHMVDDNMDTIPSSHVVYELNTKLFGGISQSEANLEVPLDITQSAFYTPSGSYNTGNINYGTSNKIQTSVGRKFVLFSKCSPNALAIVAFNGEEVVTSKSIIGRDRDNAINYEYITPEGVSHIAVSGDNTSAPFILNTTGSYVTGVINDIDKKIESITEGLSDSFSSIYSKNPIGGLEDIATGEWIAGEYIGNDGRIGSGNSLYKRSKEIKVVPGLKYKAALVAGNLMAVSGWKDGVFNSNLSISGKDGNSVKEYEFTVPGDVDYIILSCRIEFTSPKLYSEIDVTSIDKSENNIIANKRLIENYTSYNSIIARLSDFSGNLKLNGGGADLDIIKYDKEISNEDLDFCAKVKVNDDNAEFIVGRLGRAEFSTGLYLKGNLAEVRRMNGKYGVSVYKYEIPFSITKGQIYVIRTYKVNKDLHFVIQSSTEIFCGLATRTGSNDIGRGWGMPSVASINGEIEVLDLFINNIPSKQNRIKIIGDSIIEGWGIVDNLDKRYAALIKRVLEGNAEISGRGGESTPNWINKIDTEVAHSSCEYVLINLGVNDTSTENYKSNMKYIIGLIRAYNKIPILISATHGSGLDINNKNSFLKSLGELYIDVNEVLLRPDGSWKPELVNSDKIHPNVLGNEMMFRKVLFDIPHLFQTKNILGMYSDSTEIEIPLYKSDVEQEVSDSTAPISASAVKVATTVKIAIDGEYGDYGDYKDVTGSVIGGSYVVPDSSGPKSYPDYSRSDFIPVKPGDKIRITACLAYNKESVGSNATFNGYVTKDFSSYIKTVVDLPMVGITTSGRHAIDNEEFIIPDGVNFIIGSSAYKNSNGEERDLKIELSSREQVFVETPVAILTARLDGDVSTLKDDSSVLSQLKIDPSDIEQGTFDGAGAPDSNSSRIRTKSFYDILKFDVVNIESGYKYIIWQWLDDKYLMHSGWQTEPKAWDFNGIATKIKFCFAKVDDGGISPSHFGNIGFKAVTESSLKEYILKGGGGSDNGSLSDDIISRNREAERAVMASRKRFVSEHNTDETTIPMFAHSSDFHGDSLRLANFIKYCEHVNVDAAFVTGDIVESYFTDDFSYYSKQAVAAKIPMFNTIGNHEAERGSSDEAMHSKFFEPLEVQNGSISEGKGYYHRDFPDKKIRIINLNQFQEGGSSRERRFYKDDQISWFIKTLKSTPTNYGVILITHVPEHEWSKDEMYSKFWQSKMYFSDLFSNVYGSPIADIIDAFIGRTSISKEYQQNGNPSSFTVNGDFSSIDKSIEFIAYANGHLHGDFIGYLDNTEHKQLVLNVVCSNAQVGNYRDGLSDLPRKPETLVEDSFNIYGIDRDMGCVKVVRVGSNVTFDFSRRDYMTIPYK